jgi:hypothetical protein
LELAVQHIAAPAGGCFHLSLRTTEIAEASFPQSEAAVDSQGRTIWTIDAHRGDEKRFIVRADDKLSAFVELERQALTVTFYLESPMGLESV